MSEQAGWFSEPDSRFSCSLVRVIKELRVPGLIVAFEGSEAELFEVALRTHLLRETFPKITVTRLAWTSALLGNGHAAISRLIRR